MSTSKRSKRRQWLNRRRPERQTEAAERQAARDQRSDAEQLAALVARGHGHCAEARELAAGDTR